MEKSGLKFRHEVIDPDPPGSEHDITLLGDVNGDGRLDIVIGGKNGPPNLFWYENPTWTRHDIAEAPGLEAGGVMLDIAGAGRLDIVAGQQGKGRDLYWFECPSDPTGPWTRRLITNRFQKYHDQAVGDVDGDGRPEIVFLSQNAGVLAYWRIPPDPRVEPWPDECCRIVSDDMKGIEGLVVVDLDGDGKLEIIAGTNIFHRGEKPDDPWQRSTFAPGFTKTRVAVFDWNGDGRLEVVLAEGESDKGRLAWLAAPDAKPVVLRDDLFHPHSLAIADFNGDGRPDIFVGEMGLGKNPDPKLILYVNQGDGKFQETIIQRGIPTHEAKVGDLNGDGKPDIVGKPYKPEGHIDVWWNESK